MSRLIDADALIEACEQWKEPVEHDAQDVSWNHGIDACINEIKHHAPTVNAVEVVRCKDCKHHEELLNNNDGNVLCWVHDIDVIVDRNGYCNYGERKEQEQ